MLKYKNNNNAKYKLAKRKILILHLTKIIEIYIQRTFKSIKSTKKVFYISFLEIPWSDNIPMRKCLKIVIKNLGDLETVFQSVLNKGRTHFSSLLKCSENETQGMANAKLDSMTTMIKSM